MNPGAIELYAVELIAQPEALAAARLLLSPDEQERAARFKFEHLREGFTLARAALRVLLAQNLNAPPAELAFTYGARGKPELAGAASALRFNLSHSGGMAVYALTGGGEVGVDVERVRPVHDMEDIARRFFNAGEVADLLTVEPALRETAFFTCWTRKEAFIKATGEGLGHPLDSFRVSFLPGEACRFLEIAGSAGAGEWALHSLALPAGYVGALAFRGAERQVRARAALTAGDLFNGCGQIGQECSQRVPHEDSEENE
jgi:4'-phosphopantetheinyl transferase